MFTMCSLKSNFGNSFCCVFVSYWAEMLTYLIANLTTNDSMSIKPVQAATLLVVVLLKRTKWSNTFPTPTLINIVCKVDKSF